MTNEPVNTPVKKIPKERTIIAFFVGAFFGRYALPMGERMLYILIIVAVLLGKSLLSIPAPTCKNILLEPKCAACPVCQVDERMKSNK